MIERSAQSDGKLPDDTQSERLVAYLDGELSSKESEAIEAQIGGDEAVRNALRDYDRAWNVLDVLPMAHAEPSFANTTVAMIATAASEEVAQRTAEFPALERRSRLNSWLLVAAGAFVGFMLVWLVIRTEDRRLVTDLPVIYHASVLAQIDDVNFLEQLAAEPWFDAIAFTPDAVEGASTWEQITQANRLDRIIWIQGLEEVQQEVLAKKGDAFKSMSSIQRSKLIDLHRQIDRSSDSERLRRIALAYHGFVAQLTPGERADLLEISPKERIRQLEKLGHRFADPSRIRLSDSEAAEFRSAIQQYAKSHEIREELASYIDLVAKASELSALPNEMGRVLRFASAKSVEEPAFAFVISGRIAERAPERIPSHLVVLQELKKPWQAWGPEIASLLPERLRPLYSHFNSPRELARRLVPLIELALKAQATDDPMRYFAEELSNDQIDELLSLPTDEMMVELRRLMEEQEMDPFNFVPERRDVRRGRRGELPPGIPPSRRQERPPFGPPPPRSDR